jgi:hypothetical protein
MLTMIPTEPIGSLPRPPELIEAVEREGAESPRLPMVSPSRSQPDTRGACRGWTAGPFRYRRYADSYLEFANRYAHRPLKQAVISPSALSLMYPADGIPGYTREQFIDDLLSEHEVCDRILEAADYIPVEQLGTTDDCGFSPFSDDISTSRDTAFAKIRARVAGTAMAAEALGVR